MERFEEFLNERKYLLNVSHKTLVYYNCAFQSWRKHGGEPKQWVINLRDAGVKAVSVNTYICAMNAYWKWAGESTHLTYLKEEQNILPTLSADGIRSLIGWKGIGVNLRRAHIIALVVLDCGLRASEVLGLLKSNLNLDLLTIKVVGKGNKERVIPFSAELRKHLWRYTRNSDNPTYVFSTKNNTRLSVRNFERDLKNLGNKIDIKLHPHLLRHSFAVSYLRNGGNLEYLRRLLGHSSLSTTQKYLKSLGVEDLGAVHSSLSPLSARR